MIHIVAPNETIGKIADGYHCLINDIKSVNLHITDFNKLAPGTKLKIPFLSKEKMEILEETEPFISDYYPTYNGYLNGMKSNEEVSPKLNMETEETPAFNQEIKKETACEVEEKKVVEHQMPKVYPQYRVFYQGNILPKYDSRFIKKI